jgi:chromosome segregation ATPase
MNQSYSQDSRLAGGAMYESEILRLQREADNFTKHFEHEKKRLMILEDQYKQADEELKQKKTSLEKLPSTAQVKQFNADCKKFEYRLDKNLVKYNKLKSNNQNLRKQIDVMRKEQKNQTRVNEGYNKELTSINSKALTINKQTQ